MIYVIISFVCLEVTQRKIIIIPLRSANNMATQQKQPALNVYCARSVYKVCKEKDNPYYSKIQIFLKHNKVFGLWEYEMASHCKL